MKVSSKPIDALAEVIQQLGLDVTYQHDDLIFVSHNLFVLKFTDHEYCIDLYFNEDIEEEKAQALMDLIEAAAEFKGLQITYKGAFCSKQEEDDTIELEFFNLADE